MSRKLKGIGMTSLRTRERLIERLRAQGIHNEQVLQAVRDTPRHLFVDEALASRAYEDTALPIGHGQTISQPYIVARMTEALLDAGPTQKVLEIGTGSGYQTAILASLVPQVYTVERIEPLMRAAKSRLHDLGMHNVRFKVADGSEGWAEQGPYDAIMVTAAAAQLPHTLVAQLTDQGRMVVPVGQDLQELLLLRRSGQDSDHAIERLEMVNFVPLVQDRR